MTEPSKKVTFSDLNNSLTNTLEPNVTVLDMLTNPDYGLATIKNTINPYPAGAKGNYLKKLDELVTADPDHLSVAGTNLIVDVGETEPVIFDVIGFDHDGEGITTLCSRRLVDCAYWNIGTTDASNMVDWIDSSIRALLRGTFYNTLPSALRNEIVTVSKNTGIACSYNVTTNEETIWLLSPTEVFGRSVYLTTYGQRYTVGEGEQYPAFKEQFMRIKYGNTKSNATSSTYGPLNAASNWWLRSPDWSPYYGTAYFVYTDGTCHEGRIVGPLIYGVVPCFCI